MITCGTCAYWFLQTCTNAKSEKYRVHTAPGDRCEAAREKELNPTPRASFFEIMESGK